MSVRPSLLLWMVAATAQATPRDITAADRLFREGRAALAERDFDRACERFTESQRLDPVVGTELNLAECEEGRVHLAAALSHWRAGLARLKPDDARFAIAQKRSAALEPKVPKVSFSVGEWPSSTTIAWDGRLLAASERSLWAEPGPHRATFTTGGTEESIDVTLAPGDRKKLVAPGDPALAMERTPRRAVTREDPREEVPEEPTDEPRHARPRRAGSRMHPARVAGIVVMVVGAAALLAGAITTGMILDDKSTLDAHCTADHFCDPTGVNAASNGQSLTTVNAVGWVLGGLAVTTGIILIVAGRDRPAERASLAPTFSRDGAGLSLVGRF